MNDIKATNKQIELLNIKLKKGIINNIIYNEAIKDKFLANYIIKYSIEKERFIYNKKSFCIPRITYRNNFSNRNVSYKKSNNNLTYLKSYRHYKTFDSSIKCESNKLKSYRHYETF